jgi:FMN phosphatase YigB (HAD superfamily)
MLNAILFDLDNTLILYDEIEFYKAYFPRISRAFVDIWPPDEFRTRLIAATLALLHNDGTKTNAEYFLDEFANGYLERRGELWQRLMGFYATEYDDIQVPIALPGSLHAVIDRLLAKGLKLVVASNPIFPLNVQMKRLGWASLDHVPFELITTIENMSFVKPRVEYYMEICRKIGEVPQACMMVGNDAVNDMVAASAGLKTYQTGDADEVDYASIRLSDNIQDPCKLDIPEPDFKGPLCNLLSAVETLAG